MKRQRMVRFRKIIGIVFISAVFIGIPLVFRFVFHGSDSSFFLWRFPSDISVENWFNFWITYLASISSVAVAVFSLNLTKKIEEIQLTHQLEEDRLKLRIFKVRETNEADGLCVILPMDVVSLSNVMIVSASLSFGGGECLWFIEKEDEKVHLEGCSFNLTYPSNINEQCKNAKQIWLCQASTRTINYIYAELNIIFDYPSKTISSRKKNIQVYSKAQIAVKLDKNCVEYYEIVDTAVYNPNEK